MNCGSSAVKDLTSLKNFLSLSCMCNLGCYLKVAKTEICPLHAMSEISPIIIINHNNPKKTIFGNCHFSDTAHTCSKCICYGTYNPVSVPCQRMQGCLTSTLCRTSNLLKHCMHCACLVSCDLYKTPL